MKPRGYSNGGRCGSRPKRGVTVHCEVVAVEMHQVRYFLTLCQELNFTRAAEKCNVAQPALTRAIKLLEDEFGGLLLHRERARTHLSELGQAVRPYLEEVLRQSQQAKRLATSFIELKGTPLKLGIMCTIGPSNFVGLSTSLQAQYPGSAVAGCGCAGGAQEP